jgi:hypothetical protein
MGTYFDSKTVINRPIKNILRYNKVKVKMAYDELLFETKTLKQNGN